MLKKISDTIGEIVTGGNPLLELLGEGIEAHVGYVYAIDFTHAMVLTNDEWKRRVAGIPHNAFLVATSFNPKSFGSADVEDQEVVVLRVVGPASLPQDSEIIKARIEHNQRRTEAYSADSNDGWDPITLSDQQFSGLKCRILGTFFVRNDELRMGSDLENYTSCTRLRVFKPTGDALKRLINHVNPEVLAKAHEEAIKAGFSASPAPILIGSVRYTSTDRRHRAADTPTVPVYIHPSDFLARRTAVLGMTRTGKSNTVKTTISAVAMAALEGNVKVGQLVFDINGEYANANQQDDGSSIHSVFDTDCVRYRAASTPGFEDLRINFYQEPAQAMVLLSRLWDDLKTKSFTGQDIDTFFGASLEEPDRSDRSAHTRWERHVSVFYCILHKAGFPAPAGFQVKAHASANLMSQMQAWAAAQNPPVTLPALTNTSTLSLPDACQWFELVRRANLDLPNKLQSSTPGNPWIDPTLESFLNILARENSKKNQIGGYRALVGFKDFHTTRRSQDVLEEIVGHLDAGKIVILDLSVGPVQIRRVLSERIASFVFNRQMAQLNAGDQVQNVVIYVEEAHNLIGKDSNLDTTWPRMAKEGAKAKIAFVYSTQEPSSVHANILANTENWFVTHLNNDDELRALSKFYDFADFSASLKNAQDVGFARIKTLSSPFVIPTQIERFTPAAIKARRQALLGAQQGEGV